MAYRVQKTILRIAGGSELLLCDTIEHEGALWLVPEWFEALELGVKRPVRIIRLSGLRFQTCPDGWPADYFLNDPMPKDVIEGRIQSAAAALFVAIERPDIALNDYEGKPS